MPEVSIIVTTFNRKEFLSETIFSILGQSYQDFELIIIDNNSDYDFISFIKTFNSPKILPFQNNNNGIIAINRNFGICKAQGKYISFCDDDDIWKSDKLEKQIEIFSKDDAIALCSTNRDFINSKGENVSVNSKIIKFFISDKKNLLISNHIFFSSVVVRRSILNEFYFDENINFRAIEDYHLWLRIIVNYKKVFIDEKLISYRIHASNNSEKLLIGAKKNLNLFSNIFLKYNYSILDRIIAYTVAYFKIIYYYLASK